MGLVTVEGKNASGVPLARLISTTLPLTGGGDLSADRTLAINAATTTTPGAVTLAGDLGGTGAIPAVLKINGISVTGTPSAGYSIVATGAATATWQAAGSVEVPNSRTISTTLPLTGGGDLSANRTLGVNDATSSTVGVVSLAGNFAGSAAVPLVDGLTADAITVQNADLTHKGVWSTAGLRIGDGTAATEKLDVVGRGKFGVNTGKVFLDSDLTAPTTMGSVWTGTATPTAINYTFKGDGNSTTVQGNVVEIAQGATITANFRTIGLRVGSGSSPLEKLHVDGFICFDTSIANPKLYQRDNVTNGATAQPLLLQAQNATGTTSTGGAAIVSSGAGTTAAGAIQFRRGATVEAILTPLGLRIGDSTPATERLDVIGRAKIGVSTGKVFIDSSLNSPSNEGAVWLGTVAPTNVNYALRGSTNATILAGSGGTILFQTGTGANSRGIWGDAGLRVGDGTAATEKLEVLGRSVTGVSTGKVICDSLIGSTASFGGMWMGNLTPSATNYTIYGGNSITAINATSEVEFFVNNVLQGTFRSTGMGVGLGSGTNPSEKLHVVGNILATGFVTLGTNPAAAGQVRLPNNSYITQRNAANSADITVAGVDNTNTAYFGTSAGAIIVGGVTQTNTYHGGIIETTRSLGADLVVDTSTKDRTIFVDSTAAVRTITMPTPIAGRVVLIKRSAGTNNVNVQAGSGWIEKSAVAFVVLATDGGASGIHPYLELQADGTNWYIVRHFSCTLSLS